MANSSDSNTGNSCHGIRSGMEAMKKSAFFSVGTLQDKTKAHDEQRQKKNGARRANPVDNDTQYF